MEEVKGEEEEDMEDLKKRKLEEAGNGDFTSKEELRFLIEPLAKPQLVDLLAKLCVSFSPFHFFPSSTSSFSFSSSSPCNHFPHASFLFFSLLSVFSCCSFLELCKAILILNWLVLNLYLVVVSIGDCNI